MLFICWFWIIQYLNKQTAQSVIRNHLAVYSSEVWFASADSNGVTGLE